MLFLKCFPHFAFASVACEVCIGSTVLGDAKPADLVCRGGSHSQWPKQYIVEIPQIRRVSSRLLGVKWSNRKASGLITFGLLVIWGARTN